MTNRAFFTFSMLAIASCSDRSIPPRAIEASAPPPGGYKGDRNPTLCGNGHMDPGEACDDGFEDACGECNADCTGPGTASVCGDGSRCILTETCDDGFNDACGSCNADCTGPGTGAVCGDGEHCPETEFCDDGFNDPCGDCNADCTAPGTEPICGDGELCRQTEKCDDGFNDACGSCNTDCSDAGSGSVCGDGSLCPETEACEDDLGFGCKTCDCHEHITSNACGGFSSEGFLDPGEVYIFGTVHKGICDREAIAHWSSPNVPMVGSNCHAYPIAIQPLTGRLVYFDWDGGESDEGLIRLFQCDDFPGWSTDEPYPSNAEGNDRVLYALPCPENKVTNVRVGLDSTIIHQCRGNESTWYDNNGSAIYDGDAQFLWLGAGFVLAKDTELCVLDLEDGVCTPVAGLPGAELVAARPIPSGFWLVILTSDNPSPQLWSVDTAGTATYVMTYNPGSIDHQFDPYPGVLDGSGNLFGWNWVSPHHLIVRYPRDGAEAEVVYTEADDPMVKVYGSFLFTGP